jgi:hypothetical protein
VTICAGVENLGDNRSIQLYPNPAKNSFVLAFSNPGNDKLKVTLENQLGQTVMAIYDGQGPVEFSQEIHSDALAPAIYYVRISIGKEIFTRKLVHRAVAITEES